MSANESAVNRSIAFFNLFEPVLKELHRLALCDKPMLASRTLALLGKAGHPSSLPVLKKALEEPILADSAVEALVGFGSVESLILLKEQLESDVSVELKAQALQRIAELPLPEVFAMLRDHIHHEEAEIRKAVAIGLGKLEGSDEVETLLIPMLEDEQTNVAVQAMLSLRKAGGSAAADAIADVLGRVKDEFIRAAAIISLGMLGHESSRDRIRQALADTDPRIRASAVEALGYALEDHPDDLATLLPYLEDEHNRVRANAIMAVYSYAKEGALTALNGLSRSPRKWYRASAAFCLSRLQEPEVLGALVPLVNTEQDKDVLDRALASIANLSNPRLKPHLRKLLGHPNLHIRERATMAYRKLADDSDLKIYEQCLETEAVPKVRVALLDAVAALPTMEGRPLLVRFVQDGNEEVARAAIRGLADVQDESNANFVRPFVRSRKLSIKMEACITLLALGDLGILDDFARALQASDNNVVEAGLDAIERVVEDLADERMARHPYLRVALEDHYALVQSAHLDPLGVSSGAIHAEFAPLDTTTATDRRFVETLERLFPLGSEESKNLLGEIEKRGDKNYLLRFLALVNREPEGQDVPPELARLFRENFFLPGLVMARKFSKDDPVGTLESYLDVARAQVHVLKQFVDRASRYVQKGRDVKAVRMLSFLNHYLPIDTEIHESFGSFYLSQKDYDLAWDHLCKAFAAKPTDLNTMLKLSGAATRIRKLEVARSLAELVKRLAEDESDLAGRASSLLAVILKMQQGQETD